MSTRKGFSIFPHNFHIFHPKKKVKYKTFSHPQNATYRTNEREKEDEENEHKHFSGVDYDDFHSLFYDDFFSDKRAEMEKRKRKIRMKNEFMYKKKTEFERRENFSSLELFHFSDIFCCAVFLYKYESLT